MDDFRGRRHRPHADHRVVRRRGPARRGFTYVELLLATVILGGGLVAAMSLMGVVAKSQRSTLDRRTASQLAYSFLEEILGYPYDDAEAGAELDGVQLSFDEDTGDAILNRSAVTSVDDFDGSDCRPPCAADGSELPDLDNCRRTVSVKLVDPANLASVIGTDKGVKRITVVVEVDGKELARAVGLKTRHE